MLQVVEPEFYIKIGIEKDEVVSVDWGEMVLFEKSCCNDHPARLKKLSKYLRDAVKYIKEK